MLSTVSLACSRHDEKQTESLKCTNIITIKKEKETPHVLPRNKSDESACFSRRAIHLRSTNMSAELLHLGYLCIWVIYLFCPI